jgi:23S rRNA-/tRNA-specific pseudouridylate synthase
MFLKLSMSLIFIVSLLYFMCFFFFFCLFFQAIIVPSVTRNGIKKGTSKLVAVKHQILSSNTDFGASLVEVSISSRTWHFLRVYLASLLSPVLGDNVHGSRVAFKSDQVKVVNPMSHLAQLPQQLPPSLLSALALTKRQEIFVPVHVHLASLAIPGYLNKSEDLVIHAPVPPTFQWTCDKLCLELPM